MRTHSRGPLPHEAAALATEPTYDEATAIVVGCWQDLDSCRQLGFGAVGSIPFTAVLEWCRLHRFDRDATMLITAVIRRLDADRAATEASKRAQETRG